MENQLLLTLSRNKLLKNADISKVELQNVKGRLITIGEGEILFREGDIADIIFLVISGELNILKKRLLGKTKSYIFGENDFFGHEEFFEETSRTSTAVALRDSYLVALNKDEIDLLIKQDNQILMNLREPVAELDEESLNKRAETKKETPEENSDEIVWNIPDTDEPEPVQYKFEKKEPEDFFKSIADTSRASEVNLLQPLEEISPVVEENIEPNSAPFDESAFLDEDGIPKAQVELPDNDDFKLEGRKSEEDLNDALFNILSGSEMSDFDPPQKLDEQQSKEVDDAFFSSFGIESQPKAEQKPAFDDFEPQPEEQPVQPQQFKSPPPFKEKAPLHRPETIRDFEPDDIFEEAERKIREIEKTTKIVEPEEISLPVNGKSSIQKHDEAEMNTEELKKIINAAELVNSDLRVDEALKNIINVAIELTCADRGTLYLVDREKNELWSMIALGEETREIRLRIGEGLAGYVALSGETINIKDAQKDPRFRSDFDKSSGYKTKSMICFPIKNSKNEIIGVFQLLNSRNDQFAKRDEDFLKALSIHSAIALNNAEMVEKLLQTERVQSLGKMANFLIQDIKKPILVGKRYAEHLRSKPLAPEILQVIDMLLEQLSQVADLVQTTSSYSEGKTNLRTMNVSLNGTLMDYSSRLEQYTENRHSKIFSEFDKDVTVKLDVREFFQCYTHIIKNACDAMPDGGNISVSTKRFDKKVEIYFRDKGLGIPEGMKDKIFEPFMSYGKKEGTGLGLSITRKIVEALNGTIRVESALGEGATFIITLPLSQVV